MGPEHVGAAHQAGDNSTSSSRITIRVNSSPKSPGSEQASHMPRKPSGTRDRTTKRTASEASVLAAKADVKAMADGHFRRGEDGAADRAQ